MFNREPKKNIKKRLKRKPSEATMPFYSKRQGHHKFAFLWEGKRKTRKDLALRYDKLVSLITLSLSLYVTWWLANTALKVLGKVCYRRFTAEASKWNHVRHFHT
jgi:hypothetical protein